MASENLDIVVGVRDNASASLDKISGRIRKVNTDLKATAEEAARVGRVMGLLGGAIVGAFGFAVKKAADFEQGMSRVKAITNATGLEMDKMTDLAEELGRTTVFTSVEAAESMKFLGMAGFTTGEIMESVAGTMDLAAAGAIDLGVAADISSNILQGFRLEANEIQRVVDVMAKTVTSSNTDIMEMGEAMKFLAPISASLGISIEESSAAVGILANAGLKGATATAVLTTALQRLSDPTNKMLEGMKSAGFEAFDAQGEFVGLASIIEQLESGLQGFTKEQKSAALAQIFGVRANKQFLTLLAEGSVKLREYTEELKNSEGAAKTMADIQLENLKGSMTLLNSAVDGLAISIGDTLRPTIESIAKTLTDITAKFIEWGEKHPWLSEKIIQVVAVVGILLLALAPLLIVLPGIVTLVTGLSAAFLFLAANPIVILVAALIALGALLFKIFVTDWAATKDSFLFLWNTLKSAISKQMEKIKEVMTSAWEAVKGITLGIWESIKSGIVSGINFVIGKLNSFVQKANAIISTMNRVPGINLPQIPQIPLLANGGIIQTGGSAIVGESGPELLNLPTGARVTPLGRESGVTINIVVNGDISGEELVAKVQDALVRNAQLNTAVI